MELKLINSRSNSFNLKVISTRKKKQPLKHDKLYSLGLFLIAILISIGVYKRPFISGGKELALPGSVDRSPIDKSVWTFVGKNRQFLWIELSGDTTSTLNLISFKSSFPNGFLNYCIHQPFHWCPLLRIPVFPWPSREDDVLNVIKRMLRGYRYFLCGWFIRLLTKRLTSLPNTWAWHR